VIHPKPPPRLHRFSPQAPTIRSAWT